MSATDIDYLHQVLSRREGRALELKEAKTGYSMDAACEYVVALANEGGGELVLGVRETAEGPHIIVGTRAFADPRELELRVHERLRTSVIAREIEHPDGRVVVLAVPSRPRGRALSYKGRHLARAGESLVVIDDDRLRRIFTEADGPRGRIPLVSGLTADEVESHLDTIIYFRLSGEPVPELAEERARKLVGRGALTREPDGSYSITVAGAVFLAHDLARYPSLRWRRTRLLKFDGRGRTSAIIDHIDERGYALQFQELLARIIENVPVRETFEGGLRRTAPFYPEEALREFLANALVHQDLDVDGSQIVVEIFSDRVEIRNPGRPLVDVARFVDETQTRNPDLTELARLCHMCEARGSGVDRALKSLEELMRPAPLFRAETASTAVVLPQESPFPEMSTDDRVWAIFLHASLRHAEGQSTTNASVRTRFGLPDNRVTVVSQALTATVSAGLLKVDPASGGSLRYKRYVPFYA